MTFQPKYVFKVTCMS